MEGRWACDSYFALHIHKVGVCVCVRKQWEWVWQGVVYCVFGIATFYLFPYAGVALLPIFPRLPLTTRLDFRSGSGQHLEIDPDFQVLQQKEAHGPSVLGVPLIYPRLREIASAPQALAQVRLRQGAAGGQPATGGPTLGPR